MCCSINNNSFLTSVLNVIFISLASEKNTKYKAKIFTNREDVIISLRIKKMPILDLLRRTDNYYVHDINV